MDAGKIEVVSPSHGRARNSLTRHGDPPIPKAGAITSMRAMPVLAVHSLHDGFATPGKSGAASGQARWFPCLGVPEYGNALGARENWLVGLR
jgi:hypothetical protein